MGVLETQIAKLQEQLSAAESSPEKPKVAH